MFHAVVAELAIHLVGEEEEVVLFGDLTQLQDFLFGIEVAGGVVGVTNHDGLGLRGDHLLEILDGGQCETVLDRGDDGFHDHAAHGGEGVVVGVERLRDDDLVAGIHAAVEGEKEAFAAAGGDDDLVSGDLDAHAVVVFHQFFAVAEIAGGVAVGNHRDVGVAHGVTGTFRGLDVGLTDVQMINVNAATFGSIGEGNELPDRGRLHACTFLRNFRHNFLCY